MSSLKIQPECTKKAASVIEVLDAKASAVSKNAKARSININRGRYNYLAETHKPLACLVFVLPLLVWYHVNVILHPEALYSGIDRLVQSFLAPMGEAGFVVLPLVTVGIFLFLHQRRESTSTFRLQTVLRMAIESVALASILFLACDALMLYFDNQRPRPLVRLTTAFADPGQYGRVVTCVGTGIYEEVVFRLLLFAPLFQLIRQRFGKESLAITLAAIAVSLIFACAHCDLFNPDGFPFQMSTFLFRFLASVFLCILFRFRGIAIAIGVHAVFDILAIS